MVGCYLDMNTMGCKKGEDVMNIMQLRNTTDYGSRAKCALQQYKRMGKVLTSYKTSNRLDKY